MKKDIHPDIRTLTEKKLVGQRTQMSFARNTTRNLWQRFMPRRKEIKNSLHSFLYSIEVYPASFFHAFNPEAEFEKWAAIEVSDFNQVPDEMESLLIPAGLYAVFLYKGPASEGRKMYQYIFGAWLPASGFEIDQRPHFALMEEKYKNDDPGSEEEIWIPVKPNETF